MTAGLVNRLRRMDRQEFAFRARSWARIRTQRAAARMRPPRWSRAGLASALSDAILDEPLTASIEREDWDAVERALEDRLRSRPSRFVLDPARAEALRMALLERWPSLPQEAATRADRIAGGDYDLLGFRGLRFEHDGVQLDWHFDPVHGRGMPLAFWADVPYLDPNCGDHKVTWELNRHQHWLALGRAAWLTGNRAYGDRIVHELSSWLADNPPATGGNWASMLELGLRCQSWLWAMHFLLAEEAIAGRGPWLADMLLALEHQLTHVEQNLSYYFSPNTHLTGEALSLYVAGVALPELRHSTRRIDVGRRVLLTEAGRQIERDGGHAERSTHYHRYTLDFYVLALLTAERAGDSEAAGIFGEAVARLARFMSAMADDAGIVPQIGDDDGGMLWPITGRDPRDVSDSLALAAMVLRRPDLAPCGLCEEALWVGWSARAAEPSVWPGAPAMVGEGRRESSPTSTGVRAGRRVQMDVFPDTGYAALRDVNGDHLVFDVGPHGYLNGGHAHADALAVTLTIGTTPLLIDCGTATYTMDVALRNRMRGGAAHNTLLLDGRASSQPAGPFHWQSRTDSRLEAVRANPRFAFVQASHAGFDGGEHRRAIVRMPWGGWLIIDDVVAHGEHDADRYWHFDPDWVVEADAPGRLRAAGSHGRTGWLLHDDDTAMLVHGDTASGLGWCSPRYGALVPTWSARTSRRISGPAAMFAWAGENAGQAPSLERLRIDAHAGAIGCRIEVDGVAMTAIRSTGTAAGISHRPPAGDYHSDARLLLYSRGLLGQLTLAAVDATHALCLQDGLLSLIADAPVADVCVETSDGVIEFWSSQPSARLEVQGEAVRTARTLRLNGREMPASRGTRDDAISIASSDWGVIERSGGSAAPPGKDVRPTCAE